MSLTIFLFISEVNFISEIDFASEANFLLEVDFITEVNFQTELVYNISMNSFNIEYQKEPFENILVQIKVEIENTDHSFWVCLDDAYDRFIHADNFRAWILTNFVGIREADIKFTEIKFRETEPYSHTIKLHGFDKLAGESVAPWRGFGTEEWCRRFNNLCDWTNAYSKKMLEGYYRLLTRPDHNIVLTGSIKYDMNLADNCRIESMRHARHIDTPLDFVMLVIRRHSDNVVEALIKSAIDVPTLTKNIERQKHYVWSNGYIWDSQKVLKQD